MDITSFEDFIFAGSTTASPVFLRFLRSLRQEVSARGVFTHGDIRPANIIVRQGEDLTWKVVALIDWETSGFYPSYWECVKMTNNFHHTDNHDWYLYLPESVSQHRYPVDWLVDRVLDIHLKNS
ncbi:hypothetical protein EJ05DRAFT_501132 [Pseudovirgaria hyperparasitica]|uniref:Aminoglycoside phosphotransferase domain-containing protein n=1 Tax=Pseudovirgaria hyperparasitica TaxID=470096 RepID=A0A6A6W932_9PEZI|nr:uncharacterized protein EJ05DRAFT_501132 [Pseudovirgaria hyperparasitica]KAF2757601.1 hypothetical protein EJ05DRAFT_501132 [Pseudovirgaria hyperparasitica]